MNWTMWFWIPGCKVMNRKSGGTVDELIGWLIDNYGAEVAPHIYRYVPIEEEIFWVGRYHNQIRA